MPAAMAEMNLAVDNGQWAAVIVGENAPEMELFAAEQLCGYLRDCFGARASIAKEVHGKPDAVFVVGSPTTNRAVVQACSRRRFPPLSDQGIVLRRFQFQNRRAMLVGGGSPVATLWAVYELAERWGVRYLLHGDVLPDRRQIWLPSKDLTLEPEFRIRQWRVVNSHAIGPETWGIEEYKRVIHQLAKLKFNRLFIHVWPSQPFLHYKIDDIERRTATVFFGFRFPIEDGMIGRSAFADAAEFQNPDLPPDATYRALSEAGRRFIRGIIEIAADLGMECGMNASLFEYPGEFGAALGNSVDTGHHLTGTIRPADDTPVDDRRLRRLARTVLRAIAETYPEISFITLEMPEFRHWADGYREAWVELDRKYGLERICTLESLLEAGRSRVGYPGGSARAEREVMGDIVNIHFFDQLLTEDLDLAGPTQSSPKIVWDSVCEELFPVLEAVSHDGWETLNFIDYTPSSIVKRLDSMEAVPAGTLPAVLTYTLHDDNVGFMPQLTVQSLHEITTRIRQLGWAGFSARYWLIGDHDISVAYMSKAGWDSSANPLEISSDQIRRVCGNASVDDVMILLDEVQRATVLLEQHALGLAFPTPEMMMKHWKPGAMPRELLEVRDCYQKALAAARRAVGEAVDRGRGYLEYWIGRLEFGIAYLNAVELVRAAATAEHQGRIADSVARTEEALVQLRRGGEAYAQVARDQSDRGSLAVLNQHAYRPLSDKIGELSAAG